MRCLIVCRGPVRKEAIDVFAEAGLSQFGMLLSEKDSVVYPKTLAPELRGFPFPENVHRIPDYMGVGQAEKDTRISQIIDIARSHHYTHIFAGYGFMAEDADFIAEIEAAGIGFVGPSSGVCRRAGAKDEAKRIARELGASVTPGVDNVSALALLRKAPDSSALAALAREHRLSVPGGGGDLEEAAEHLLQAGYEGLVELVTLEDLQREAERRCDEIWARHPGRRIRFKHIGGGGGKGQRIVRQPDQVAGAVFEALAEAKVLAPGSNRNFLIELNIERTRHNEIQLLGNGSWCISLGGRDCSVQMHEQKLLEVSLTEELLAEEIARCRSADPARAAVLETDRKVLAQMEDEGARFGEAVGLDSVSTFESIVEGDHHFFMEMNTRIQVEHRVTEMVYRLRFDNPEDSDDHFYVDSLIEAMLLLSAHGKRLPRPQRTPNHVSGAEVRINATNQALQPHAGGTIFRWSDPLPGELRDDQGIGIPNPDTGSPIYYHLAGAYDSNIALVVAAGGSREENFRRLAEILRRTELRGSNLQTNLQMHYGLLNFLLGLDAMAKPTTQFMSAYLAAVGALAETVSDLDLELAWREVLGTQTDGGAREALARKQTLLVRPIERLFSQPHWLAGFLSLHRDVFWREEGGDFVFAENPIRFLATLYRYLHLESSEERPPSEQIWEHDAAILDAAVAFYDEVEARVGTAVGWADLAARFESDLDPAIARGDQALWEACAASHRGFQLGAELLLMIPRAGRDAGFFDLGLDAALEPTFPERLSDAALRENLTRALAPPPPASSDEIVTPMGGHLYIREAPHLPPMISAGDHFEAGQALFIIEVMKMFNKVRAPFSGTVVECLPLGQEGAIVAKGQPVFKVKPDVAIEPVSEEEMRERRRSATLRLLGSAPADRSDSAEDPKRRATGR